jgi:Recombination directionality factor-like
VVAYAGSVSNSLGVPAVPDRNLPTEACPQPVAPPHRHALPLSVLQPPGLFAGHLRYATFANGHACTLPTWLITIDDQELAASIATVLGGRPHADESDSQGSTYHVITDYADLHVLLDGPQSIRLRMLRRHGSKVLRCCNGRMQQTPYGTQPCHCPSTLNGRWQAAKAGQGCEPLIHVAFRLTAAPTLGRFLLASGTWSFAIHAAAIRAALRRQDEKPVRARLMIDCAVHSTANGTPFAYSRPMISILSTGP